MAKIRGTHSSPGTYTQFTDLEYAAKTLGITTLGLVGETLKGPAFETIPVSSWAEYVDYFGGTSPELFKDTLYPKYETSYIAESYLKASDQLYVCRVLGLSGYNAGPAFVIKAIDENNDKEYVVAVLRSRGSFEKYSKSSDCKADAKYDTLNFDCDNIELVEYKNIDFKIDGCVGVIASAETKENKSTTLDLGHFTILAKKGEDIVGKYPVSLNVGDKDYIYNVLGSKASEGSAKVFVEEFYDNMLYSLTLNDDLKLESEKIPEIIIKPVTNPVSDFLTIPEENLTKKLNGTTYIYAGQEGIKESGLTIGQVYKVVYDNENGEYVYDEVNGAKVDFLSGDTVNVVKVMSINNFVCLNKNEKDEEVVAIVSDYNDYHEQFRCATTPWIVSEMKGNGDNIEVKKLFRFHTITDGNYANEQVKISIANIKPDDGTFDVLVRDFNDSDASTVVLESYKGLTMVEGDSKYIGLKIGTVDGAYECKSKYIMAEVISNDMTEKCVPCGFLGYPVRSYDKMEAPKFEFNIDYDENINERRQYFGLSDIKGVDIDILTYKGKCAYTEDYSHGYTNPFHLDSRMNSEIKKAWSGVTVTIDGDMSTTGLTWETVSPNAKYDVDNDYPKIGSEADMVNTIFEKPIMRKFTVYPYGGFDGWDIYRKSRTNTDEYKANKYKGKIENGYGKTFSKIDNAKALGLSGKCITSDYYAYLAGAMQFENTEKNVINLFATPGIDYVNNNLLTKEILEMIVEKRGDALYVPITPDKPAGASDDVEEMYTSADAAANLEDAGIDTYFGATYYPWVKYFDKTNSININLSPTKDALRDMANVDNKRYPWYSTAGIERGDVECSKLHFFTKIEDEDNVYNGRINPLKTFSKEGVKIWGNKTMYTGDTPMNRVNVMRLMLYMRKLVIGASNLLVFDPNDATLKDEFYGIINPILSEIKSDRGITDYRLKVSQTEEQMDAHEISATLFVKPTPTLEYIEINFVVSPQGVTFDF